MLIFAWAETQFSSHSAITPERCSDLRQTSEALVGQFLIGEPFAFLRLPSRADRKSQSTFPFDRALWCILLLNFSFAFPSSFDYLSVYFPPCFGSSSPLSRRFPRVAKVPGCWSPSKFHRYIHPSPIFPHVGNPHFHPFSSPDISIYILKFVADNV